MSASTFVAQDPIQQWTCGDTIAELQRAWPRILPVRPIPGGVELTWSDFLAGAGGSSSGIHLVPGCWVVMAVNHWPIAVQTHNMNLPWADHDVANVARVDPRRYQTTDMAWFSPECTFWSVARGEKCDYDAASDQLALPGLAPEQDESPAAKEARWRSRMLMRDVVRFTRHHRYRGVIVENVPDILKWARFDDWLKEMHDEGYRHKVITLNSAFAGALGDPAPQLRDRVYVVFWRAEYRTPDWDKWLRPACWCPTCGDVVQGIYTAKPGPRRPMRYGPRRAQYFYRCPKTPCRGKPVEPYVMPADAIINYALPTTRIGDRKRPLAKATRARVAAGIARHMSPVVAEVAGNTFERRPGVRTSSVRTPITTQTATATKALACPPLLVPAGGTWRDQASPADRPMPTVTATENSAVVEVPPFLSVLRSGRPRTIDVTDPLATVVANGSNHALVVPLRRHGVAAPAGTHPIATVAAGGTHHALVMRNNQGGAEMLTPTGQPVRTLTTKGHQSLVQAPGHALFQYDTGTLRPLSDPLPTQTTVEGDALLGVAVDVDDCTLRMLAVDEIKQGMAFDAGFLFVPTSGENKIRMLGNAVTPPAARDLAACLMEAITGVQIDLAPRDRFLLAA